MATGIPSAHGHQNIIGPQAPVNVRQVLGLMVALRIFANALHILDRALRMLEQKGLHLSLAPTGAGDDFRVLRRENHNGLPKGNTAKIGHRIRHRLQNRLRRVAAVVFNVDKPRSGVNRNRAHIRRITQLYIEIGPWVLVGPLCDAKAVLAGITLRRFVRKARNHLKNVKQNEPNGASNRSIGPVARPK